ncbi:DNA primase family protein [Streptosporangium sp. G11]|uniref:DNA primase family protein n=1 Tax=Streptosporangium sp. G11 TaxID=3436926 RepID=UPI003EBCC4A5
MTNLYDPDQVNRWLATLHGDADGLTSIVSNLNWSGRTFPTTPPGRALAVDYVGQLDAQGATGIYARVTTLREQAPTGRRGEIDLSLAIPGFWTDLDIAGPGHKHDVCPTGCTERHKHVRLPLPEDVDAVRRIMAESGLPAPSVWIHSGGGAYTYHLFDEPYLMTPETIPVIAALSERFQQAVKASAERLGYEYAPVGDLARVLRIPGTINRKEGLSRACFIMDDTSGVTYPLAELTPLIFGIPLPEPETTAPAAQGAALPFNQPRPYRDDEDELSPGDDFNDRASWDDILGTRGWTRIAQYGAETRWCRPGKSGDTSATTGRDGMDNLYVFSTSTEFETQKPYSKFGAYTQLTQGSTSKAAFSAATKALRAQGYGSSRDKTAELYTLGGITPGVVGNTALATVTDIRRAPSVGHGEQHRGHLRMAERFVTEHADTLRYVHGLGWHRWDEARWAVDDQRADIVAARQTIKTALADLKQMEGQDRDDLFKDIRKSESSSGIDGMVKIASALPPISVASKELDADPHLFNTTSGTLDLLTGNTRPNDRADLITKVAGAAPQTGDDTEWLAFLARILPDPEVRAFVQRLAGYSMLGKVVEHVMPIWTGTGANGKGTLRDALMAAFGDYAIEIDPAMLMEAKHERHGAFKMRLRGARLVFCSETEKGRRFAEATMKRLVGGDPIEANLMHKNPITFIPSHTLIMLTNHLPAVSGDDPAVWRRLLVVPFDVVIPEQERDGKLPDRLRAAAPAILAWAHQGWLDYQQQGLNPPEAVRARTQEYQASSDALGRFLDDRTIGTPHGVVKARELYTAWTQWCYAFGEEPGTEKAFAESMDKRGHEKKKRSVGMTYLGLILAADEEEPKGFRPA